MKVTAAEKITVTYGLNAADKQHVELMIEEEIREREESISKRMRDELAVERERLMELAAELREKKEQMRRRRRDWPWLRPSVSGCEIPEDDADLWRCGKRDA